MIAQNWVLVPWIDYIALIVETPILYGHEVVTKTCS